MALHRLRHRNTGESHKLLLRCAASDARLCHARTGDDFPLDDTEFSDGPNGDGDKPHERIAISSR